MAWRNCESYVSSVIWHGEVGCSGKRELYENMGKTSSSTVCCFKGREGAWKRETETDYDARKIAWCSQKREEKEQHGGIESESNLHTIVQIVMRSDSSAGGERESGRDGVVIEEMETEGALVSH